MKPKPTLLSAEEVVGPEWAAWYALTPMQRWEASQRLWPEYLALGGSLDPEIDTQSPFWSAEDLAMFGRRLERNRRLAQRPAPPADSESCA